MKGTPPAGTPPTLESHCRVPHRKHPAPAPSRLEELTALCAVAPLALDALAAWHLAVCESLRGEMPRAYPSVELPPLPEWARVALRRLEREELRLAEAGDRVGLEELVAAAGPFTLDEVLDEQPLPELRTVFEIALRAEWLDTSHNDLCALNALDGVMKRPVDNEVVWFALMCWAHRKEEAAKDLVDRCVAIRQRYLRLEKPERPPGRPHAFDHDQLLLAAHRTVDVFADKPLHLRAAKLFTLATDTPYDRVLWQRLASHAERFDVAEFAPHLDGH